MSDLRSRKVTVIVTGVGGGGIGEQVLKALRRAETAYEIVATDTTPVSMGFAIADHRYVVPAATDPVYIERLLAIGRRHNVAALFVGSEPELRVVSRHRDVIQEAGIFLPINPPDVIETCLDKERTARFLEAHGYCVPRTIRIAEASELEQVDFFPAVLKPSVGGGGSADVSIAQDRNELSALARALLSGGRTLVAQEYVGTPQSEYTVGILTSMKGELINSIAVRRYTTSALGNRLRVPNRTNRRELGDTLVISSGISQGEIGRFPVVTSPCERMAADLGSRGPLNIQCRLVDGQPVVFEINPRFSGTTSVRAVVGYNEPDVLVREGVLGERVERHFFYRSGVVLRGLTETLPETENVPNASEL